MSRTGDLATLRFFFAKKQVDECNGDITTVENASRSGSHRCIVVWRDHTQTNIKAFFRCELK